MRPRLLLFLGAERDDVLAALDRLQARLELDAARRHGVEIDARQARVDFRQPLHVRALARVEDVVEGAEALDPTVEIAIELQQVAVVLEPFLETIARQELVEIAALDGIGDVLEAPIPTRRFVGGVFALAEQARDQLALLDAVDRAREAHDLAAERFDRVDVVIGRLLTRRRAARTRTAPPAATLARPNRAGCARAARSTATERA